jgi:hypothetical protein
MNRDPARRWLIFVLIATVGAAVGLAAGAGSGGAGRSPRVLPPEKQAQEDFERQKQEQGAAFVRRNGAHRTGKPAQVENRKVLPEKSGIADSGGSHVPGFAITILDRKAYKEVDGPRVRVFYGVVRDDGVGGIFIIRRGNAGLPAPAEPAKVSFRFVPSPVLEGGLHIVSVQGNLLLLKTDHGTPVTFNMGAERFGG